MKICHILWGFGYGGIETMVTNIANEQARLGHEVVILVINDIVDRPLFDIVSPDVKIEFIGRKKGSKNPLHIIRLNRVIKKLSPDIVHFHHPGQNRLFFKPFIKKHCTTIHIDCLPYLRPMIKKAKNLHSISKHVHDDVMLHTSKESEIVDNGILPERFRHRKEWFDGKRTFRIVQLGRLDFSHKGQDVFIRAMKVLKDRNIDVMADIIGEGACEGELRQMIETLGLFDSVRLLGAKPRSYIYEHLADYDLLVHPSRHEGFGLVIAEGMASKVPVLVSDVDVQREIVGEGICGYVFANGDSEAMAEAIEKIMNNYSMEIIESAYRRVLDKYNVRRTAENYIDSYIKIQGG